jgi:hypothetical protein
MTDGDSVRVRGIYTTALTELLREEYDVVQASPPIRERFDADFEAAPADVTLRTTDDRQGVGVSGEAEVVADIGDRLADLALDTFVWGNPAPQGAVFQGVVDETLGSGAVVDLGDTEGWLPYDRTDGYVNEGDTYRVQVAVPKPPWDDDRPSLATDLRVPGGLVELHRDGAPDRGETARMADLLPVDPPEGWSPKWSRTADDASLDAMADALEDANDRAEELMSGIAAFDADDAPGRIVAPEAGVWTWFGREARFALDEYRRAVETTMPGHHRVKAATNRASAAVDFAEALCEPEGVSESGEDSEARRTGWSDGEFPFDVTTRQFGPQEGDSLAISHGKPDGRNIVLGRGEVVDWDPEGSITLEREMSGGGTYDALGVKRHAGDIARTTFAEGSWWYATVYEGTDGTRRGTYVNVCTPVEIFPHAVRYVDLHVDVVKGPDGEVRRVDDDELDDAVEAGYIAEDLADRARTVAASIENGL